MRNSPATTRLINKLGGAKLPIPKAGATTFLIFILLKQKRLLCHAVE